jgi:hypothetical protein
VIREIEREYCLREVARKLKETREWYDRVHSGVAPVNLERWNEILNKTRKEVYDGHQD